MIAARNAGWGSGNGGASPLTKPATRSAGIAATMPSPVTESGRPSRPYTVIDDTLPPVTLIDSTLAPVNT